MQTTHTYVVIAASGTTVNVRADRQQAFAELRYWRQRHPDSVFAIVLETCYPSGRCDEEYIVSFYQPLEN